MTGEVVKLDEFVVTASTEMEGAAIAIHEQRFAPNQKTVVATDEFGFAAVDKKVHVHDLQATIMHTLGVDHERLTFRYQGRDFRLTDVHGKVVHELLA